MPFYVLKLGGSLMATSRELVRALLSLGAGNEKGPDGDGYSFLVVPGGGPMADLVREIYSREGLSQEAAHWMAVLAMEQYARFLADGTGAALTTEIVRPGRGEGSVEEEHLRILLPYQALLRDDFSIEHNWDFTSDAVAALVAARLSAPLIKATDVDGIFLEDENFERYGKEDAAKPGPYGARGGRRTLPEISAARLMGVESCLDQGTVRLLCGRLKGSSIWILNGSDPDGFICSLKRGEGGTVVKG